VVIESAGEAQYHENGEGPGTNAHDPKEDLTEALIGNGKI
jgi:hypothetical protein